MNRLEALVIAFTVFVLSLVYAISELREINALEKKLDELEKELAEKMEGADHDRS